MKTLLVCLGALVAVVTSGAAQRRARFGPTLSWMSLREASGNSHTYPSYGATVALLTGDDAETGLTVSRYNNLAQGDSVRRLTFFGVDSYYYPVGARGVAPFALATLGLARVTESQALCPLLCKDTLSTTSQLGLGFGLGVRLTAGDQIAAFVEGRFFQVPQTSIQALEARANVSVLFGTPRQTELLNGTVGPEVGALIPVSGPMQGRGPSLGVRFRRDTKKPYVVLGLEIDYVPLRITQNCTSLCDPSAIFFAPGYEASAHTRWGRIYGELGVLLGGFYEEGPDRGIAQGAHGGLGVDIASGQGLLINLNSRLVWFQRSNSGENVFAVQVGAGLSPALKTR
jgi:hypothetical protein